MTTRGRQAWWAVVIAAVAGLLLSVVVAISADAPEVREVVGDGSVSAPATSPGPRPSRPSAALVDADDASLEAATLSTAAVRRPGCWSPAWDWTPPCCRSG